MLEAKDSPMHLEAAKLRAELDVLKAAPAATEPPAHVCAAHADMQGECMVCGGQPALARFLPRRPDDVPAPPDGWVYVGRGNDANKDKPDSLDILNISGMRTWVIGQSVKGIDVYSNYAIRWTAAPDIWHRFGLLAPSEGGGWIPHRPGDAMPCEGRCEVLLKGEIDDAQFRCKPGEVRYGTAWCWDSDHSDNNTIGWRPALAEVAK
jgi:hypothetical protein